VPATGRSRTTSGGFDDPPRVCLRIVPRVWRELAAEIGLKTAEPATANAVRSVEDALGCTLPHSLRQLLLETNGLTGEYELEVVMSAEEIVEENTMMRSTEDFVELYMPFDHLLFFGRAGNGDLFAFPINGRQASDRNVFLWDHEDDSRVATSASLERYLRGENWHEDRRR
jgi:SMI1/KNR4 family protein SUKH-1